MVAVPGPAPKTVPPPVPIVATPVLLLVHVPPPVASVNDVVAPWHIVNVPSIGVVDALTVTIAVAIHPDG